MSQVNASEDNIITLPLEFGNTPVARLTKFYIRILAKKMGTSPTISYPKTGAIFKRLLKHTPEIQVAVLLMAHFNYNPHKGDEFLAKRLKQQLYPIELFQQSINIYKTYLIYEKQIEYDDIDNLKEIVYNYIDKL